jgi:hypothetical protein
MQTREELNLITTIKSVIAAVTGFMIMQSVALSEDSATNRGDPLPSQPHSRSIQELIQMQNRIRADRLHAPEIVSAALKANSGEPILCVSTIVRVAIRALGDSISKLEVARLVRAAVETRPDAVLQIVRTAIMEARPQLHPDILAAAVGALPDPFIRVCLQHLQEIPCVDETFFEERKRSPAEEDVLGYGIDDCPDSTTLAELIATTAIGAGSTAGVDALYGSINNVLSGPWLFPDTDEIPLPKPTPLPSPSPVSP